MPTASEWSLWIHIVTGTVALLAGLGALVTTKSGRRHRRFGRIFLVSMGFVVATVLVLLAIDPRTFRIVLALVAIFSGYLAFSGYRALSRKRPAESPHRLDWAAAGVVTLACLSLAGWGSWWLLSGQSFGIVMLVFGGIGAAFGSFDIWLFRTDRQGEWTGITSSG